MQNDDMIWHVINKDFCSFKVNSLREDMCRNEYNVSGKCNRVSCPLANSHYATVTENNGQLFLCLKTVERAHLPRTMWEKIVLPISVDHARDAIEKEMRNAYKDHQIERCKHRAVRLKQMLDRMRRMKLKTKERLVPVKKKTERREATREKKAEVAAHLEDVIESELLNRLQQGVYGRLYTRETPKTMDSQRKSDEEYASRRTQTRTEQNGHVTVEQGTDDEESVAGDNDFEDEVAAAERHSVLGTVSPAEDIEDLAPYGDRVATRSDRASPGSRRATQTRSRAEEISFTEYNCKRLAVCAAETPSSILRKRPRFFEAKPLSAGYDEAPETIPIFNGNEGERLHTVQ